MSTQYSLVHEVITPRNVPILTVEPTSSDESFPRIIVLHGLRGRKEEYLEELYLLASMGYRATAIDLFGHGERSGRYPLQQSLEVDLLGVMKGIIYETASDISSLIDHWEKNIGGFGLLAVSAGGLAAHAAVVADERIDLLAAIITSPDWTTAISSYLPRLGPSDNELLAQMSPVNAPERYAPRAVLMLVGEDDEVVSPAGSKLLSSRLEPIYQRLGLKDRLKLVAFPNVAHKYTSEMRQITFEWIRTHLPFPAPLVDRL